MLDAYPRETSLALFGSRGVDSPTTCFWPLFRRVLTSLFDYTILDVDVGSKTGETLAASVACLQLGSWNSKCDEVGNFAQQPRMLALTKLQFYCQFCFAD